MLLSTSFRGRVFQVIEALDFGDAVSNQVVEIDGILRRLGLSSAIHCQWFHEDMQSYCRPLASLQPTDEDIVILHFAGYSEYALPYTQKLRCTKICVYHNITPHEFFAPKTDIHAFCLKGRKQIPEVVRDFHFFWGDSQYNLDELIAGGADPATCAVIPIVVARTPIALAQDVRREEGAWLFLGRVAANKGHAKLVELFAKVRSERPEVATRLYLVGSHHEADPYYQQVTARIKRLEIEDQVVWTGKVSDAEVEMYLAKAEVYVSLSEHEGFGVPLIEAAHHDLPVVALRNTAVGETMGSTASLGDSADSIATAIVGLLGDPAEKQRVLAAQKLNAARFTRSAVENHVLNALRLALPRRSHFRRVSVVICTYNRSDLLARCLDYLRYQTNQNFEVIVVNGPSTDNTEEVLAQHVERIKVGRNPERNLSKSRNIGIELADGELIAFIDDDALPFDDWIDTLLREFSRRPLTLAAIGGPAYYAGTLDYQSEDIGINRLAEARVNIESTAIGSNGWERSLLGTNTCFRTDLLRKAKGFDEQFDYFLDESELCLRLQLAGHIVGYCPDLYLRHEFAQSDNRRGNYKFNWFTICKNTAYYIAAYSGLTDKALTAYIDRRMLEERIRYLEAGRDSGAISAEECKQHVDAVRAGAQQGLADAASFPRTRELRAAPGNFQGFTSAAHYPLVGRDLKALHVCIVSKEFPPFAASGGIGTLYYHLASELLLMGHTVTVIVPGEDKAPYVRGRFSVVYATRHDVFSDQLGSTGFTNNMNWSVSALRALAELHSRQPVDVVDCALWDYEALALALLPRNQRPAIVVRLVTPFPVVSRLNAWAVPIRDDSLFRAAEQTLISQADAVVPISDSIARTIEVEYGMKPDNRWIRSYCGVAYWPSFDNKTGYTDLQEINGKKLAFDADSQLILFVGRLEGRKGVDVLLRAAVTILAENPKAHLLLAGRDIEAWSDRAATMMTPLALAQVHFLGEVSDATREKLLNVADCLVFASRYESFGLVPLEAFVHGVPVVAARSGAIPEVVEDDESGLLYSVEDHASLARHVLRLLSDGNLRARLSAGAKARVRHLSSRNSAIRAVQLYARLSLQRPERSD